jgi:hypothetical protein
VGDDDGRVFDVGRVVRRKEQVTDDLDSFAEEINFLDGTHGGKGYWYLSMRER